MRLARRLQSRECPVGKSYPGHLSTRSVLFCGGGASNGGALWRRHHGIPVPLSSAHSLPSRKEKLI